MTTEMLDQVDSALREAVTLLRGCSEWTHDATAHRGGIPSNSPASPASISGSNSISVARITSPRSAFA